MKVDSAYIAVKDRERAKSYRKRVFGFEPAMENDTFIFFDLDGFLFGLFDPSTVSEKIQNGNNCVLNLRVSDADAEVARLGGFSKVVMPVALSWVIPCVSG